VENLPGRYAAIADCAYKSTEHMIPIYGGNDATNKQNDTFNFFASQLRIRIEMERRLMSRHTVFVFFAMVFSGLMPA
jgi:hypothetical protein